MTGILDDLNVVVDAPVVPVQNLTLKRTKKKKNKYERRRQKARKAREQKTLEEEEGSDECNNQQIRVDKNCTFNKSEQVDQSNTVNDPHPILVNVDNEDEDKDRDREAPNHSLPHGSKAQDAINNSLTARVSYRNTERSIESGLLVPYQVIDRLHLEPTILVYLSNSMLDSRFCASDQEDVRG